MKKINSRVLSPKTMNSNRKPSSEDPFIRPLFRPKVREADAPVGAVSYMYRVLRPLVRLAIGYGLRLPQLVEMLKALYVDIAEKDFCEPQMEVTDSRVTLLTGVHRKDVRRLRTEIVGEERQIPKSLTRLVLDAWTQNHLTADGSPEPLARTTASGGARSFETLVASVSRDIASRSLLNEMVSHGLVLVDADDRVHNCEMEKRDITDIDNESWRNSAQNVHDMLSSSVHNLLRIEPRMPIKPMIYGGGLTAASIAKLEKLYTKDSTQIANRLNALLVERQAADSKSQGPHYRMAFGTYQYWEPAVLADA
jgi:hypothetical protein